MMIEIEITSDSSLESHIHLLRMAEYEYRISGVPVLVIFPSGGYANTCVPANYIDNGEFTIIGADDPEALSFLRARTYQKIFLHIPESFPESGEGDWIELAKSRVQYWKNGTFVYSRLKDKKSEDPEPVSSNEEECSHFLMSNQELSDSIAAITYRLNSELPNDIKEMLVKQLQFLLHDQRSRAAYFRIENTDEIRINKEKLKKADKALEKLGIKRMFKGDHHE